MQVYELIIIFLVGAGLGVTARYIMGYRRKSAKYVVFNILFGRSGLCVLPFSLGK